MVTETETETDTGTTPAESSVSREGALARRPSWGRTVFIGFVVAGFLAYLYATRVIWPPIIAAFLIAVVLDPLVDQLENRGWRRGMAAAAIFLIFFGSIALVAMYAMPVIVAQSKDVSRQLNGMFQDPFRPNLVRPAQQILSRLHAPPAVREPILRWARIGTVRLSHGLEIISGILVEYAPNLIWLVVVPVLAFYALTDFHLIYAKGLLLVPRAHRPMVQRVVSEVTTLFGKYVRGLLSVCTLNALATALVLTLFQLPYALVLGFIAGTLYAVPYIGPVLNVSMIGLLALVTTTPGKALGITASIVVLHQVVFDQVITPRVLGRQVGLHPILAIIALMSGSALAGPLGMLIAVPLAASVQIIVLHLVPKLGHELQLRPLEALERTVAATKAAHRADEAQPADDHFRLETVIENVE